MKILAFYLIISIFILSFTKGVLELLGISSTISQLAIDGMIAIVFLISMNFILKRSKIFGPGIVITIFFLIFILMSYILNDTSFLQVMLFLRMFLIYYLLFYAMLNIPFTNNEKAIFLNSLVILFLIQIPAAFVKLLVLGGTLEKIVGTLSVGEGSLATIMPLLASAFLISKYLVFQKLKDMILILLFISIGLISNKLGILFYEIFLFILLTYLYSSKKNPGFIINTTFLKKMLFTSFYIAIIFALFVTLNPRANPEHRIGGSVDIEYLIKFTENYNTLKLKGSTVEADGRSDAPFVAFEKLYKGGLLNVLIGYGPGDIVKSSFIKGDDPLLSKYNIGYGGRLGIVWMMIQVGLVGVVLFLSFHLILFYKAYRFYKSSSRTNKNEIFISLTILSISIIYFIDFFSYSSEMLHSPSVAITYFIAMYYLTTYKREQNE